MYLKKKIINLSTSYKSSLKISGNNSDRKFSKIFVINIFVSFLELLGIGLLIPIINFFIESEDSNISNFLTVNLGLSFNNIIFITALAFLIKNILIFFSNKYQVTVIYKLSQNISKKLYEKYINQDLNFYIKGDTSQALRNIFNECYSFSNGIILSFLKITSEIFLFLIFFIFLLFVNYKVTILITFFLSLIALIFFFSVQKKLRYFGDLRQFHESHRIKFIREGFESFSFLKIFDLSDFFLKKYHEHNKSSHNIFIKERVISFLPKLILETSLILLFCIIIFFLNLDDLNKNKIFFDLAVISLVALRLLPVFNSSLHYLQQLRFNMPVINKLETLLNESINLEQKNIINHKFNSLKIKNISFSYGKNNILKNINIEFPNSGIVLINGSSGSGKTTLMNIIMGLLKIESGEIFYNNKKITYPYIIKELAYVPQNTFIFDDTIKSNIILNRVYDENKFKKILEICKLEELNNKFDIYKNAIGSGQTSLSGGQKQRVSLARAIYGEPSIIVLDEPFSSLDVSNFNDIINNIKKIKDKFNCLFILVSHVTIPKEILDAEYIVNNGYITKTK